MKGFINMLFLAVALQSACFLCSAFQLFGPTINYPLGTTTEILTLSYYFDLSHLGFMALMGIGGAAAITIVGMLTRSGQYMLYALLIWGLGAFIPVISYFVLSIPNTIGALITSIGVGSDVTSPLIITLGLWVAVWGALYAFGLIFQRDIHT
jgi:hypothetical protein